MKWTCSHDELVLMLLNKKGKLLRRRQQQGDVMAWSRTLSRPWIFQDVSGAVWALVGRVWTSSQGAEKSFNRADGPRAACSCASDVQQFYFTICVFSNSARFELQTLDAEAEFWLVWSADLNRKNWAWLEKINPVKSLALCYRRAGESGSFHQNS